MIKHNCHHLVARQLIIPRCHPHDACEQFINWSLGNATVLLHLNQLGFLFIGEVMEKNAAR
jgi:hypothetical protein